jgi:uncharacterized protein
MIYVDTSVLVALCTQEATTEGVIDWYERCTQRLVSNEWCVTEFASAMSLKLHTAQLNTEQAHFAWAQFERICAGDLQLIPIEPTLCHQAAKLIMSSSLGLRAGDALHLACALEVKTKHMATLDRLLAKNAAQRKIHPIAWS